MQSQNEIKITESMATMFRENSFIITISSLSTVIFIALVATLYLAFQSSMDSCITPLMIIDLLLVLVLFIIYFCKTAAKPEEEPDNVQAPSITAQSYHDIRIQHKNKEDELNDKKLAAVREYVHIVMSPYLKEIELQTLILNISQWVEDDDQILKSVTTDGRLTTLDLRHFAWNIGERFKWKGVKRATFIKLVFPFEMRELEIETIRRNLRQNGNCLIELDIPEKGKYEFFQE